jgi:glycosyltransferase involved in cell wall biosynthesis
VQPFELCLNTQTPLLQFATHVAGTHFERDWPDEVNLAELKEGEDYTVSPGGVTRMVYPLVRWLAARGIVTRAHWVALNPNGPRIVRLPGLVLHNIRIPRDRMGAYGKAKEAIWAAAHGRGELVTTEDLFWSEEFSEYAFYNRQTAEYIRALDRREDFDLFYIHDFQQLQVGSMLDTLKPKLFRWHIPFERDSIPPAWHALVARHLASYDTIIVSSDRYREALREFGHRGRIVRIYPYVDPQEYRRPDAETVRATCARWGLDGSERVILVVGRMDPTKGQDRAIRAFARISEKFPSARLLLVGNGSFSGSSGGPGLGKATRWRAELERLVQELGLAGRVIFTGHATPAELDAAYERAAFTVLPSVREGFGLVVVESWIHDRPAIVSRSAGVAELVQDGQSGIVVDSEDAEALSAAMARLLKDHGPLARRMVAAARPAAEACTLSAAMRAETGLLAEIAAA